MIDVHKNAETPATQGPEEYFTGSVTIAMPFATTAPARLSGAAVTFQPGARTAWHTHPLGQTLIVTQGQGIVQEWGKSAQLINPGDTVWIPPNVKHWHGATATQQMTHIAIAEAENGHVVTWMEHVSEGQYRL